MAAELVSSATSNKLKETDWTKNFEICAQVARDHSQAKDVVKAIKKRLGSKHQNCQLFAVMLLEMMMHNIGEPVHEQVVEAGILPILVKIVKKKSEHPVRERIFLLLDAAQTSVGGASGRFPQYYSAYYELVSAGVQFPQRPHEIPKPQSASMMKKNPSDKNHDVPQAEVNMSHVQNQSVSDPSHVLLNAAAALEVLRDVLDAIDTKYPEAAKDEFTLDLVEQCCFQKQRVMHLAVNSLDEVIIAQAVVVNEQLEIVLRRHDALLDGHVIMLDDNESNKNEQEEEEAEQLFQRMRKGKAREGEPLGVTNPNFLGELLRRPLIRPLTVDRQPEPKLTSSSSVRSHHGLGMVEPATAVVIPPPPAQHVEREKFFEGSKSDGSGLSSGMSTLSLHSRDASSSQSGSTDFSDL